MKFSAHIEEWKLKTPFRISGYEWTASRVLVVELSDGGIVGRGEAAGVYYIGEDADSMYHQVERVAGNIERGANRSDILELLPAGGARNAVDCALWDFEAKISRKPIWDLLGMTAKPVTTVFTIGIEETPEQMAAKAAAAANFPILKIKLDDDRPIKRLSAIRAARPDARLVVDANQSWTFEQLKEILPQCAALRLEMIEQPLPRGEDSCLDGFYSPVLLAADESCLHSGELDKIAKCYGMINIKLDKTGGLTEALYLAKAAQEKGLKLMIGNMTGTSLAMAPSFVIAQLCDLVDIDGPLLLKHDRPAGLHYEGAIVSGLEAEFWG